MRTDLIGDEMCTVNAIEARRDPRGAGRYAHFIDDQIDANRLGLTGPSLWRVNTVDLFDSNDRIYAKEDRQIEGRQIIAACHLHAAEDGHVKICGLAKRFLVSGFVPRLLVSHAIADTANRFGWDTVFEARIRLFPPGFKDARGREVAENVGSRRLFEALDFSESGTQTYPFENSHRDAHLAASLESDGTYRNMILRSGRRTLIQAREFLNRARGVAP